MNLVFRKQPKNRKSSLLTVSLLILFLATSFVESQGECKIFQLMILGATDEYEDLDLSLCRSKDSLS